MAVDEKDLASVIKALDEAGMLNTQYKNNPASVSLTSTPALQGPLQGNTSLGGLFSAPGVRPDRFSALPRPRSLARLLLPQPSDIFNEIISIVTGALGDSGANATGFCASAPTPGPLKQCSQKSTFGQWFMKSNVNSVPSIGFRRNRADIPGQILNDPPETNPLIPDILRQMTDTRSQEAYELYLLGISLERSLEKVVVQGVSTKTGGTSSYAGWIAEFDGIDSLIKTGYKDFNTGVTCPASDSIVINYGSALVGNTIGGGDGRTITSAISDVWYALQDRAAQTGYDGVEWAIVMRKELFRALTDIYANNYATTRFQANSLVTNFQDATSINSLRVEMLNGQYLLIEGVPVPVVFSDGVALPTTGTTNQYSSDIYFVPLSWAGRRLLRLEYFDMGNQYITQWNSLVDPARRRVINNGMFMLGYNTVSFCDEYLLASQMRLILETPFLAGRIDNVAFTYLAATHDPYPGASMYVNGGNSYYTPGSNGV